MDTQQQTPQIDPLRRVFVPIERPLVIEGKRIEGVMVMQTLDKQWYVRGLDGAIRSAHRKVRGKAARRADKESRRCK